MGIAGFTFLSKQMLLQEGAFGMESILQIDNKGSPTMTSTFAGHDVADVFCFQVDGTHCITRHTATPIFHLIIPVEPHITVFIPTPPPDHRGITVYIHTPPPDHRGSCYQCVGLFSHMNIVYDVQIYPISARIRPPSRPQTSSRKLRVVLYNSNKKWTNHIKCSHCSTVVGCFGNLNNFLCETCFSLLAAPWVG